eukprot:7176564-Heterocapsa_arctica.AAC.1
MALSSPASTAFVGRARPRCLNCRCSEIAKLIPCGAGLRLWAWLNGDRASPGGVGYLAVTFP